MKFKRKEKDGKDRDILVCETGFWIFKREKKFLATEERPRGYWRWVTLPDHKRVQGMRILQLDTWNREY